jgi:hypothetical protein
MKHFKFGNINIVYTEKEDGNLREKQNRRKVAESFGFDDIFVPIQRHTNKITTLKNLRSEADGIYTDRKNTPIGVLTADCVPIVLFNTEEVAVVHGGWRGLFNGIVQNAVEKFKNKNLNAFVGANIKNCCYEVQNDFVEKFKTKFNENGFFEKNGNGIYFNLNEFVRYVLYNHQVKLVHETGLCTSCDENLFSYRKGDIGERILTFCWISD